MSSVVPTIPKKSGYNLLYVQLNVIFNHKNRKDKNGISSCIEKDLI